MISVGVGGGSKPPPYNEIPPSRIAISRCVIWYCGAGHPNSLSVSYHSHNYIFQEEPIMSEKVVQAVRDGKIVVIIRGVEPKDIVNVGRAIVEGGITALEVTFNQAAADGEQKLSECVSLLVKAIGDKAFIGAGTVMNTKQVDIAKAAGATFIVSPNTDVDVIKHTKAAGLASFPGALTPSEAVTAYNAGADMVKLFPAGDLGVGYLKSVLAPLRHIPFVVVGGIDVSNIQTFLKAGASGAGVGGSIINLEAIKAGEFGKIKATAKELVEKVKAMDN